MSGGGMGVDGAAVAQRVLDLVRARSASAEAEVMVRSGSAALTRFANGVIHQNVAEELSHVALRVALDGRVASAAMDGPVDDDRLGALVDGALAAAAVSPVDLDWPGLAAPEPALPVDHWDEATAAATPDDRAARVAAFIAAAGGLVTAGALSTEGVHVAFANAAGQALAGRASVATLDAIARTPTSDGVARSSAVALSALDARASGELAARKARDAADPTDLPPGRYEVVLEPSCVADLVGFLVRYGFGGLAVEEGRSFVRLGEPQLDAGFTFREDATHPRMAGLGFDAEGTPKRPFDIVRDGVPRAILHDRRTAAKAGTRSTGNAAPGPNPYGEIPVSAAVEPGSASIEDLVAGMERGLLVSDFWYTRVLDPRTLVVTGLTRNGVWLVEDGRIVRPVRNLRFTQSYPDALAPGAIAGIGREQALFPDGVGGGLLVPAMRLAGWGFSGGSRG